MCFKNSHENLDDFCVVGGGTNPNDLRTAVILVRRSSCPRTNKYDNRCHLIRQTQQLKITRVLTLNSPPQAKKKIGSNSPPQAKKKFVVKNNNKTMSSFFLLFFDDISGGPNP